ncbi:MAG: ABC transporter ATP-binding protein [bacterium]|nr:ABC transporter ATP-binding protein [bacterium]
MSSTQSLPFSQILSFAWKFLKDKPGRLFLAFLGLVGTVICDLLTPVILGKLTDFLSTNAAHPSAVIYDAIGYVGLFVIIGILYWIFRHFSWFIWARMVVQAMQDVGEQALYKVQRFSTDWHESSFSGATVTKIKRGMRGLQSFIDLFFYNFIPLGLLMVGMMTILVLKHALLGIIIGIGMLIYAVVSIALALRYVMPASTEENRHDSRVGAALADVISCSATVKSFAQERAEDQRFHQVMTGFRLASLKSWFRSQYTNIIQDVIMTLYKVVFLGFSLWLWITQVFTVGDFIFVFASYRMIAAYLRQIGDEIRRLQMAAADMEDVIRFAHRDFEVKDTSDAKVLKTSQGKITFDKISFTYRSQRQPIFSDFSLTIEPGEKIALVGHSGAGKSTFVKLLQRLYDVQRGAITIDGLNIADVTLRSLRDHIVLVPQDAILFHRSLEENIRYGNPEATAEEIIEAARKAHAHEFIDKFPEGYQTMVGERGIKLSGGERQRVAIARAILSKAPILILDEATSSLDSISEHYIQDALDKVMKNRTTIAIAHRLSTIKKVDRILVFENGRIAEEGTHESLVHKKGGIYQRLYEMQAGGFIE